MRGPHPVYRGLLVLYPRSFREEFADDLVQLHADLVADRGPTAARGLTALDLIVTVPRYRLEHLMSETKATTTLYVAIAALAVGGAMGVLTGLYPLVILLGAAVVLAVSQRAALARAIRTPDTDVRRRRLLLAGVSASVFAVSVVTYGWDLSDDEISSASLLAHSFVGTAAMIAMVILLIAGLLTPRSPATL
ncbi:MAG TPA: hypothetical protein VIT01_20130 [Acidimicrobiales bacterium]